MPRGSRPGERRGGRQRGTPNKITLLQNAVICAAAVHPNASPLDFILGLMRAPTVPTDVRIEMAAAAASFVHTKPKGFDGKRTPATEPSAAIKIGRGNTLPNFSGQKVDAGLNAAMPGAAVNNADLAPLDFLIGVMNDPETPPRLRIKAARVAAPYLHAPPHPDQMPVVIEDPFGFDIDPAVARAMRDDKLRADRLRQARAEESASAEELESFSAKELGLRARIAESVKTLRCPPGYGGSEAEKDERRLQVLTRKRASVGPFNVLTEEEDAEEAHLMARVAAYRASPEGQARARISELDNPMASAMREWKKKRGKEVGGLTAEEQSELDALRARYPDPPAKGDPLDILENPMRHVILAIRNARLRNQEKEKPTGSNPDQKSGRQ